MKLFKATRREAASQKAASSIADAIQASLESTSRATLIASGGNTPADCYRTLSHIDIPWDRVDVVPSDERQVALDDSQRNTKMLRECLRQALAERCSIHEIDDYGALTQPAAITLLGMGEDGHFASIFPDISELDCAVDLSGSSTTYEIGTSASPVRRKTLSLRALCNSQKILLLAFGEAKLNLINQPTGLPIEHLLNQSVTPVEIIWSP